MTLFETSIKSPRGNSRILIGNGILSSVGEIAAQAVTGRRAVVVSDGNVCNFHLAPVMESLRSVGFTPESVCIPAGEKSKSVDMLVTLWNTFCGFGITRTDVVVALGGGVVGDLAGFAAATFLRGCPIIQVPTSLLAQVDSSIGGKTGIDLPFGKNLAGAFHQPRAVVTDPLVLKTLPQKQFSEGMAEVVKYGCICDAQLLEDIEAFADNTSDADALLKIITRCVQIKADIVGRDELDTGERMILNFGHTIGHAIEKVMGYGYLPHGDAVAVGMVAAARLGESIGKTPAGTSERIIRLLDKLSLPTATEFSTAEILEAMKSDKKKLSNEIHFILLEAIGRAVRVPFALAELQELLEVVLPDAESIRPFAIINTERTTA